MNLADVASGQSPAIALGMLAADRELATDIQGRLIIAGILDPPVDGRFGPVSNWALAEFCRRAKMSLDAGVTSDVASALIDHAGSKLFPLNLRDDFAGRVAQAMTANCYFVHRHPDCCNIVYIEGCDEKGRPVQNVANEFNDVRLVIAIDSGGAPVLLGAWNGTTEPGKYWTETKLMDKRGAARIAFGQYKAWAVGTHRAGRKGAHEALVQVSELTVHRDLNKDYSRIGDKTYTGLFGINQHWGYDFPVDDLSSSSAGCLVGRETAGHKVFMTMVKRDARYRVNHGFRFMTTIMPSSALK